MSAHLPLLDETVRRVTAVREAPLVHDVALLVARIGLGWIFIYHGAGTLFGAWNGAGLSRMAHYFATTAHLHPGMFFAVLNGITEFFGGIAVAIGLFSRLAAIALVGDMVIAMITVAWANGIIGGPGGSGYEINLALCVLAVVIALLGPGRFSLDAVIRTLVAPRVGDVTDAPSDDLDETPPGPRGANKIRRLRRSGGDGAALSDEALLAGMANHDERAGLAFVRRHERRIFGIAFAIVNDRTIAEDVAQEAFIRVWRHAAIFDPRRSSVVTWSSTITRNLAIDALRLRRALPVDPDDVVWVGMMSDEHALEDRAVRSDEMARARAVLRTLPVDQRRALMRSAFYGQSAQEIADAEHIPLGTAKSRIRIGLTKVRDALAEEGVQ